MSERHDCRQEVQQDTPRNMHTIQGDKMCPHTRQCRASRMHIEPTIPSSPVNLPTPFTPTLNVFGALQHSRRPAAVSALQGPQFGSLTSTQEEMTNDPDGWIRLPHLPLLVAVHLFGILPIGTCAWKGPACCHLTDYTSALRPRI